MEFLSIFLAFVFMLLFCYTFRNKNGIPTNWPIVGMLPGILKNVHRIHEYATELMDRTNLTFWFKGPWYTAMDNIIYTGDPRNIHYVMSKNFNNYNKGAKFKEIFEVFGDGFINVDGELWKYHRKMVQTFLGHPQFHQILLDTILAKVENGLIPILNHASKQGLVLDLQDLFARFMFDNICALTIGYDSESLCVDLPSDPFSNAMDDLEEAIFYRHLVPISVWKFLRWLGVGKERKFKKACKIVDNFIYSIVAKKQGQMKQFGSNNPKDGVDVLTLYKDKDDKFLRDTIMGYFMAGRSTTSTALSWFLYLLNKNPTVQSRIRQELNSTMKTNGNDDRSEKIKYVFTRNNFKETNDKLVYLHGALCEALRLYPSAPFQIKNAIESDVLPSGHQVKPGMQIIFNSYAMARMKSIWGEDCCEFKPERWISPEGKIRHEPSYKFLAFNAGPRSCVGKDMAFTQIKVVAATILQNYEFQLQQGHSVVFNTSIILRMKYGFKVKVSKSKK